MNTMKIITEEFFNKLLKCSNCGELKIFDQLISKSNEDFNNIKDAKKARFRICQDCRNDEYGFCVDCDRLKHVEYMHDNSTDIDGLCEHHFNNQYDGEF